MTRSDIGIICIIYLVCAVFCIMTLNLKEAARIYPFCLISGLALLNTLYLGRCLLRARRGGIRAIGNDLPQIFSGFLPGQFFFVVCACLFYLVLLRYIGFYLSSLIYLVAVMRVLKVRLMPMCVTIAVLGSLVYGVFTVFLKVPLPQGVFFG